MTTSRPRIVATALMALGCLAAAGVPLWVAHHEHFHGMLLALVASYALLLMVAGGLTFLRSPGAQLFARSIWWSAFGAGILAALFAARDAEVARPALVMVLGMSTALLSVGRRGIAGDDPRFALSAYRGVIMVSMIMALADAQALGWLGSTMLYAGLRHGVHMSEVKQGLAMLACGAVALTALLGLYKLRLWGLMLSAVTTLAIGALAFTPMFGIRDAGPIPYAFAVSAAIQMALLAPLFVAIVRHRAPSPPSPRAQRIAAIAPAAIIIALAVLSAITVATEHSLMRL
jgi:hypothetical protein